jgi:hypothetical protein
MYATMVLVLMGVTFYGLYLVTFGSDTGGPRDDARFSLGVILTIVGGIPFATLVVGTTL